MLMKRNSGSGRTWTKSLLMGTSVLAGLAAVASAVPAYAQEALEQVTVTGYRASLQSSTNAKREAVNFSDSVFAEDIGKFPDTNIAEAFARIPGVTIQRENDGTGMRIALRGLGTDFVKITLNGAVVQTMSTGPTGAGGNNREVDLNIFPIELFTKLDVSKSPTADMLEGGASGVINMRSMRPFDNPGLHFSYGFQVTDFARNGNPGARGTLTASYTEGPFGVLVGISGQNNRFAVKAYEGAGNSVTTPNLTNVQYYATQANLATPGYTPPSCSSITIVPPSNTNISASANSCNTIGGNTDWNMPTVAPAGVGVPSAYVGKTITSDILMDLNPGLSMNQISNATVPRTGGPAMERGNRKRYNGILAFEYRPSDNLHFYLDNIFGKIENNMDRSRVFWIARSGASIPMNMVVDANNVLIKGDMANAQVSNELRPYREMSDYISINPGFEWEITDLLHVDAQVNYSDSHFFRDSPTYLVSTPVGVLHYDNSSGMAAYTMDGLPGANGLNDPANWGFYAGSDLRLQQERRHGFTKGAHFNASYGGDEFKVQVGAAYDDQYRLIRGYDNGQGWKDYGCGAGLNINGTPTILPTPNSVTGCSTPAPSRPAYPGYGTGFTAGWGALTSAGPALTNATLQSHLHPSAFGFVLADYAALDAITKYSYFASTPNTGAATNLQDPGFTNFSVGTTTNISSSVIQEKTIGFYGEVSGTLHRGDQKVKYTIGGRWIRTLQALTGYTSVADPRNTVLVTCPDPRAATSCTSGTAYVQDYDGKRYPNTIQQATMKGSYSAFLPSANIVWEIYEDFQVRAAVSRTMTRANPATMVPQLSGGGSDGQTWNLGNPNLRPYYSTNIDFGAELYTGNEGYIGVNIFKKMMTGFPNNFTTQQPFPYLNQFGINLNTVTGVMKDSIIAAATGAGCPDASCWMVNIVQARNATGLETIKGVELNWVQPLDFLLKDFGLEGFGWQANATWVSTKTTPNSAAPSVVLGVSPAQYNVVGYYDNDGITLRMSYNYQRGTITGSNVYGLIANRADFVAEYSKDFATVDLSSSMKLSKIFGELPTDPELTFDVQNLFHAKNSGSYKQWSNIYNQIYNPGSLFMFGIRGSY
jgi:TonB-dependent receptor